MHVYSIHFHFSRCTCLKALATWPAKLSHQSVQRVVACFLLGYCSHLTCKILVSLGSLSLPGHSIAMTPMGSNGNDEAAVHSEDQLVIENGQTIDLRVMGDLRKKQYTAG